MSGTRRSTLNDLAESLGLSANTVSRALTGKDGVSARTRELVKTEAERIGYIANPPTRATASGESKTIALTITSSTNVFSAELIASVEAAARAAGYAVHLRITEESFEQEELAVDSLLDSNVAGAIVIPVQGENRPWSRLRGSGIPVVAVSRDIAGIDCDFVGPDSAAGMYAAAKHLLNEGDRSIVYFEEDLEISTIAQRLAGFRRALSEVPDSQHRIISIPTRRFESSLLPWQPHEAYRACLDLLEETHDFDSIAVGDDYFALGVARALKDHGLRIPDDVRLIGYGNHPYAGYLAPSLSSIDLPTRLIGEIAVSLLLQRMAGDTSSAPVRRLIKPELVIRESTNGKVPLTVRQ